MTRFFDNRPAWGPLLFAALLLAASILTARNG